jgi:hypothetical protein
MSAQEVQTLEKRAESYRDYPIELKAAVIAAIEQNGGNVLATSKLFNLPPDTVRYWWANSSRFREIQATSQICLADKLENIAHSYADSLAAHDLQIVTARDKAAVIATAVDKMQLLRGLPTDISTSIEKVELTVVLQDALRDVIDITPE